MAIETLLCRPEKKLSLVTLTHYIWWTASTCNDKATRALPRPVRCRAVCRRTPPAGWAAGTTGTCRSPSSACSSGWAAGRR